MFSVKVMQINKKNIKNIYYKHFKPEHLWVIVILTDDDFQVQNVYNLLAKDIVFYKNKLQCYSIKILNVVTLSTKLMCINVFKIQI